MIMNSVQVVTFSLLWIKSNESNATAFERREIQVGRLPVYSEKLCNTEETWLPVKTLDLRIRGSDNVSEVYRHEFQ